MNIRKITPSDKEYPKLLRNIPGAPKQLYVIGGSLDELLDNPTVAIVGSRKLTAYGKTVTTDIAAGLAKLGFTIISGLAIGVDGVAHRAALDAGGQAIAVLACGLDTIYPAIHRQLAKDILARGGALITEYPEGTEAYKTNFVARNRIVSGLAQAVIITEAAEKSGSLHTANFALEQGREVLAVPGNITSQFSVGTNNLIKAGATPLSKVDDVLHALGIEELSAEPKKILADNKEEQVILSLIRDGVNDVEDLLEKCGFETALFNQTITMLEISGKIRSGGSGRWEIA